MIDNCVLHNIHRVDLTYILSPELLTRNKVSLVAEILLIDQKYSYILYKLF